MIIDSLAEFLDEEYRTYPDDIVNTDYEDILYCSDCIKTIKSFGEQFYVGDMIYDRDESEELGITCNYCGEYGNLYECEW